MDISSYMMQIGQQARIASRAMAMADTSKKNTALLAMAKEIDAARELLIIANQQDLANGREKGLDAALLDRLELTPARIDAMLEGLYQVAALVDPIGAITDMNYQPSGIQVGKMRVPLGVVGIIYESRPNVTVEAASLCLKSGNAAVLRGGSESILSNQAIAVCVKKGLLAANLPEHAVQVIDVTDRAVVGQMITMPQYIDVIIPRGGKGLIERISKDARVPVIKHLDGICHVYIDDEANTEKAVRVAINAKTQRYGTCNTMETLLIAESRAAEILPLLDKAYAEKNVELRVCEKTRAILSHSALSKVVLAVEEDWRTEYLAPILSIKIVSGIDAAIEHINTYSSQHTDSIITENYTKSRQFIRAIDSSSVMVNASTRFADGFEYGLGAEIGISTDKFHARGPVGLEGLTSQNMSSLAMGIFVSDNH